MRQKLIELRYFPNLNSFFKYLPSNLQNADNKFGKTRNSTSQNADLKLANELELES